MLIFALEDELSALRILSRAIEEAAPTAELRQFTRGSELLRAITEEGSAPDVVFSDIRLPGMDGLQLAVRVKSAAPETKLVFVTGYSEYALEAYRRHVHGYVMKPVNADMIRAELDNLLLTTPSAPPEPAGKLRVRCFGFFEVFWEGKPLVFHRKQTKELLAYLVNREGALCSSEEIALALWEGTDDISSAKNRIRVLLNDLRTTLRGVGMEAVLVRERRLLGVDRSLLDCDYYRMRAGDMETLNGFEGKYMLGYSWAELTAGRLYFEQK